MGCLIASHLGQARARAGTGGICVIGIARQSSLSLTLFSLTLLSRLRNIVLDLKVVLDLVLDLV